MDQRQTEMRELVEKLNAASEAYYAKDEGLLSYLE